MTPPSGGPGRALVVPFSARPLIAADLTASPGVSTRRARGSEFSARNQRRAEGLERVRKSRGGAVRPGRT